MKQTLMLAICWLFLMAPGWAAPQIKVESSTHDFGEIVQGDKATFTFRFKNTGDEPLDISNVRSSCGCTAALLSAKRIAPGDTGEVKSTFDSTRFRGRVTKTITMTSNAASSPTTTFKLTGMVKEELVLSPLRINFGKLPANKKTEVSVQIENHGADPVTLEEPKSTHPNVTASLADHKLTSGGKTQLRVSATLPADLKRLNGYVMIRTDHPKVQQLRLSVSAALAN